MEFRYFFVRKTFLVNTPSRFVVFPGGLDARRAVRAVTPWWQTGKILASRGVVRDSAYMEWPARWLRGSVGPGQVSEGELELLAGG